MSRALLDVSAVGRLLNLYRTLFTVAVAWLFVAGSFPAASAAPVMTSGESPSLALDPPRPSLICNHIINSVEEEADGAGNYANVQPGDVVCLQAGPRPVLELKNFHGTEADPIVFINSGGVVLINGQADDYAGIEIFNSEHLRMTGTGVAEACGAELLTSEQSCGIVVRNTERGVVGSEKTRYLEIDHLEVHDTGIMGIFVRTKGENAARDTWTQYDTYVHHNYIHHTGTEGAYVGGSDYDEGIDPVLIGVDVSHNLVTDTGWNGLQVGSAVSDCVIHHNRILRDSQENDPVQKSGITNNRGSSCHIYNNFIVDGASRGIYLQGNGGNRVYNNIIVRPGQKSQEDGDGIAVYRGSNTGESVYVWHNTIIEPTRNGVRFRNNLGTDNRIQNNLIVDAGHSSGDQASDFDFYDLIRLILSNNIYLPMVEAGDIVVDQEDYVYIGSLTNVDVSNNLYLPRIEDAKFINPNNLDFSLQPSSPAIDAGLELSGFSIDTDYNGVTRPQGALPDVGAFEFVPKATTREPLEELFRK